MSSKATKGRSRPTCSPARGFLQLCQELWARLNSWTLCKTQKMCSEPPRSPTFDFGGFQGLTCLCRLRPCWTRAGEAVSRSLRGSWRGAYGQVTLGGFGASSGGPFSGSSFGWSILPEAPGAAILTEPHVGLQGKLCLFNLGEASLVQRLCPVVWPCTTLVCSFFFFREKGFPLVETRNLPPSPLVPCSRPCRQCWLMSWFDS